MLSLRRNIVTAGLGALLTILSLQAFAAPKPLPTDVPWYNVSRPLDWQDLAGRAVLLDFFTPGCINCVHMLPIEEQLTAQFDKRLVIIGIDAPKFTDSGTIPGLKDFIRVHQLKHPVVLDAHLSMWKDWHAFAWPTFVLVAPDGTIAGRFIGEQTLADLSGHIKAALEGAPSVASLQPLPLAPLSVDAGGLNAPGGIAVSAKWVAISDTGHNRIILADHNGKVVSVVGSGCAGGQDGGYAEAQFSRPHGLTFHNGKLYVADTRGQRLRVIDLAHQQVATLAGSGKRAYVVNGMFPAREARLNSPWDVAWLGGKLYVSMAGDHQIWRYNSATGKIGPWAGSGREGLADGGLRQAQFAQPSGIVTQGGKLYVSDPESSALRVVDPASAQVATLIGQGLFRFGLKDGAAASALLQHNEGLALVDGTLFIADTFNDALRRLDMKTLRVTTLHTNLAHPQSLAMLSPGELLIVESGGSRIDKLDLSRKLLTPWRLTDLPPAMCQ